jgi:hypothetical protein
MKVCDEKIIKLKERIKSELPVYSQEQINRSREVTLDCVLRLGAKPDRSQVKNQNLFNSPLKDEALRKVFKDQTERAILKSKQISNLKMKKAYETKYTAAPVEWKKDENNENGQHGNHLMKKFEKNNLKSNLNMMKRRVVEVELKGEGERIVMVRNLGEQEEKVKINDSAERVRRIV